MKCIYQNNNDICTIWEEGLIWNGVTNEGVCFCIDNDDPSEFCVLFDSENPDGADCSYE